MKKIFICSTLVAMACLCGAEELRTKFLPGQPWPDDHDIHINAHGGGVINNEGTYYWFGEHKIAGKAGNEAHVGVWTTTAVGHAVGDQTPIQAAYGVSPR